MTDADDREIDLPGIDAWFEQVLDGEAPADAPARYADLAVLVRTARSPGQPDELRAEGEVVRRMSDVRAAAQRRARSRPTERRSAAAVAVPETAETAGHPAARTLGRVVALKAAAVTTATVIGVTAAAAATTGLVATVVVPALTEEAPVDRPIPGTTERPEPSEGRERRASPPRRQDSDRNLHAPSTCESRPAPCATARSRATTTTRTTDGDAAGASTADETPAPEVPGTGTPAPGSPSSEPPAEATDAPDAAPPVQPGTLSAPDEPGPGHSSSSPPSPPSPPPPPAQPPGHAPGPASPPAHASAPDRPNPPPHAPAAGGAAPGVTTTCPARTRAARTRSPAVATAVTPRASRAL